MFPLVSSVASALLGAPGMQVVAMSAEMSENLMGLATTLGLPLVLIVVFYFVLIRPQRKKDKEVKNMHANLKVGDRVLTIGGIYGQISAIKDDVITIAVGKDKTELVIMRDAVRALEDTPADKQNDVL